MRSASIVIIITAGLTAAGATSVAAQPTDNKALAEQLFTQGKDLSKAGDWAAACPKFEASLRYDPALGTRLNLATCYEKVGKLASAWALYKEAVDLARKAGDDKRRAFATRQVTALEPRLPRLTITAPASSPPGLVVTRGGTTVDVALFGSPTFVDPGEHEIVASAPGFEPYTTQVVVLEDKAATVALPDLTPAKPEPDADPTPDTHVALDPIVTPDVIGTAPAPRSKGRRLAGLATVGGGVALVGVGLYFGSSARGANADAKAACGGDLQCDNPADLARSQGLVDDARHAATLATVLTGVGAAAIVGGAVLWLTAPAGSDQARTALHVTPTIGAGRAALVLGGQF